MRNRWRRIALALGIALSAGCVQHVMVPQLVRSYMVDWSRGVGPDGKALAPQVMVLVSNEPYLHDQCAAQVRVAGAPLHSGPPLATMGCVRISPQGRPEIVVPDTNEQAAITHQLEHLRGKWCHDAQRIPIECPR